MLYTVSGIPSSLSSLLPTAGDAHYRLHSGPQQAEVNYLSSSQHPLAVIYSVAVTWSFMIAKC